MKLKFISLLILLSSVSFAQELNCEVQITTENIQQTDPSVFKALEEKVRSFMNETVWTNDRFDIEERIDCSVSINIQNEISLNRFSAIATIKSTRPVYNSSYNTVMIDIIDKDFEFEFDPYTVLEYRENDFANNLTSALAFYAYTIIGYDYDSFKMSSGNQFHKKAEQIVVNAATSGYSGWTASNTNNGGDISRYWINQNFLDGKYTQFKMQVYNYHRKVMDQLYSDPNDSWKEMVKVMSGLERIYKINRNLPVLYMFFDAKSEEIVEIMQKATPEQKRKVSEALQLMDPINTKRYKTLLK